MRRAFTVLTAVFLACSFSSMACAQAAAATDKKPAAKVEKAAMTKKPASVKGTVTKFDETTRTLTVGDKEYSLAADAKVMAGAKEAKTADLTGKTVKVTYTVVDGKNVASKVTVAVRKPAASPKPTEKPAEKK